MDELFLLPAGPVAMPRAYWLDPKDRVFTSGILLVEPSPSAFNQIMDGISNADSDVYDMEIMNQLYGNDSMVIPHRPYLLLTGEFRGKNHEAYLGNAHESWDAEAILKETKYLHFSDWPVPKVGFLIIDSFQDFNCRLSVLILSLAMDRSTIGYRQGSPACL